ncbi:MAG: CRISPR system precrRNA processing endoribonuclease RAMP protein Cas6 [Anaerolineae bacterium]|jgi:CRISPR-associated endoribonuclease Cas6
MLTSLVVVLEAEERATLPPHLGRASHAVFLRGVAGRDPDLAERLHALDERRPFTCSSLVGARVERVNGEPVAVVAPGQPLFLRYTGLTEEVSEHLLRWVESPPPFVEVEGVRLTVRAATLDPSVHPWAGQTTYVALLRKALPAEEPLPRHLELEFLSPTAFHSGGRNVPLPLPDLVYGSLVEKWNDFSPVTVSPEVRRFARECMAISRYELATRAVLGKGDGMQIGFVGRCRYAVLRADPYWLGVLHALTDYAFYAGVGYQTTTGMGQARRMGE